jgi:hypothetical protein
MINEHIEPYNLDWGVITPDGYKEELNLLLHVFNVDVSSRDNIKRITIFVIGRVIWFNIHAPAGANHKIMFDLRGKAKPLLESAQKMKEEIITALQKLNPTIKLNIEILN